MLLYGDRAGLENFSPMAIVVLGRLGTSTLFSLVGVPAKYLLFGNEPRAVMPDQAQNDFGRSYVLTRSRNSLNELITQ